MEYFKVIFERENALFSRKEIVAEMKNGMSPKRTDVEALIAEKFSAAPETIKVDRIIPKFGSDIFMVYAKIYKSKEEKEVIEPKIKSAAVAPQ